MEPRIIYARHFPPRGYSAITLLWWVVVRSEYRGKLPPQVYRHEKIHVAQWAELAFVLFPVVYVLEYAVKLVLTRSHARAYRSISLEQEAYDRQGQTDYLTGRHHYRWMRYIFSLSTKK